MASVDVVKAGTLGELNPGLTGAVALLNPLALQLDGFLNFSLGPLQADLQAQLQANVSASASIALSIGDPLAAIRAAIAAVVQLQAAFSAALALGVPTPSFQASAQIQALAAANVALQVKLGLLDVLIQGSLQLRTKTFGLTGTLGAALAAGPAFLLSFDGISDNTPASAIGGMIQQKLSSALQDPGNPGVTLQPNQPISGVLILTSGSATFTAMGAILPTT